MKKVKTTIYVVLYSFLVCIAMSMGVFAVSMPQIETYTNIFYHTKTPMIGKTNFQNAYLALNEEATSIGNPVISEIYFDSYEDADRDTYNFTEGNGVLVSTNVLSTIDVSKAQDESIFAHYYTYYNRETSSHIGAMFVLSTETITMPQGCADFFSAEYVYGEMNGTTKVSTLTKIEFNNIDTSVTTSMHNMFYSCKKLASLDLSLFDTKNVKNMAQMFYFCTVLKELDLSHFNTSNVTSFYYMFRECNSLERLDVSNFDTSNKIGGSGFSCMFHSCNKLKSLDLSSFTTTNVTNMNYMFLNCQSLESLDLSHFDTTNVTNMGYMFSGCNSLTELDISNFNTSKVTSMAYMFNSCQNLVELDLSHFDTSKVTTMNSMFIACYKLQSLDISSFDTSQVTNMTSMFSYCPQLENIYVGQRWNTNLVSSGLQMFSQCSSLPNWEENGGVADKTYAYAGLDETTGKYGYLTLKV
ncbi:MAG: BspA family leucine-rich repeat surface protein [Clostridia bacterium]|nr:BspA family leucine-rich repeat surface protein [Clostridia bacterium]